MDNNESTEPAEVETREEYVEKRESSTAEPVADNDEQADNDERNERLAGAQDDEGDPKADEPEHDER